MEVEGKDLIKGFNALPVEKQAKISHDFKKLDVAEIQRYFEKITEQKDEKVPVTAYPHVVKRNCERTSDWNSRGLNLIKQGKVACLLLGAGEGTRLGFKHPKGMFDQTLPSHSSLFALQAMRLRRLFEIATEGSDLESGKKGIPWFIMTNERTSEEVKSYFRENNNWGLSSQDIIFFTQDSQPSYSPDGDLYLTSEDKIASSPNGNGGLYRALVKGNVLKEMEKRGIEYIFVYGVDNILVRVCDPVFIGSLQSEGADVGVKVVSKKDPHERVGVLVLKNGSPAVVEYSEISKEEAEAKDEKGDLRLNTGNICIHAFSLSFLKHLAQMRVWETMPLHVSKRNGLTYNPITKETQTSPVWKLEFFVFDVFLHAKKLVAMEVKREEEFAGIKNKEGIDSPATALSLVSNLHRSWIEAAGGVVKGDGPCEVSPLLSYAGEGMVDLVRGKTFSTPIILQK